MTRRPAAFAIPGDITTVTGGYIYERRLLETLRALGHDVGHIELGGSFPDPTARDMHHAVQTLAALPSERALILDGLVYGSIETAGLARVRGPIVAMIHHPLALETGLSRDRRDHLFKTERDNLALAAHVLVPSPHTARILNQDYGVSAGRITVARPGIERRPCRRDPDAPALILSVGIQHPRKGHDVLLRALSRIRHLDWRAVIVGSAYDPAHSRQLADLQAEPGLRDRVILAGGIPDGELDALFARASIFALATRYEGYGMVFDEALLRGLPIVSCNSGAVPETVPAGAGLLVDPNDPAGFAEALQRLLTDRPLRLRVEQASETAGRALPEWRDTALIAGGVLDRLND